MSFFRILPLILLTALIFIAPYPAHAFSFDKNTLITNYQMTNDSYLTAGGIEAFLREKGSVLAGYMTTSRTGKTKLVSEIIKNASRKYDLNPMMFLVMAQKESSAITRGTMSYAIENWLLGYGRCDSCSESVAAPYRGITNQIHSAAAQFRESYLSDLESKGHTISGWGPGLTKTTIDGISVTPTNDATAALYTYNPCVGAYGGGDSRFGCNSAFQKLWQEWNPNFVSYYPNGSLLQVNGTVYLIQDGKKRPFTSISALVSNYDFGDIIQVPLFVGEQYPDGVAIQFPNYSLLRSPEGTVFLYVDGYKRGITSSEVFRSIGFNPEEIVDVNAADIDKIPNGQLITSNSTRPTGALVQNSQTGAITWVDPNGKRHDVWDKAILDNNFPSQTPAPLSPEELNEYKQGQPLKLKDGTIVTSPNSNSVYVIANGRKRPFKSKKAFDGLGYQAGNIIMVPDTALDLHSQGKFVRLKTSKKKK
ncbi:MAG: hypothetical protein ABIG66_04615 [Candidatus Kerfeldbacteria bacterium]